MAVNIGFAGTYTRKESEGIYQFALDTDRQILQKRKLVYVVGNPTYLTIADNGCYLYSVAQDNGLGGVNAYEINRDNFALAKVSSQLTEGKPPCHLSVNENELITSNYHKGTVEIYSADNRGNLDLLSSVTHDGSGPHQR